MDRGTYTEQAHFGSMNRLALAFCSVPQFPAPLELALRALISHELCLTDSPFYISIELYLYLRKQSIEIGRLDDVKASVAGDLEQRESFVSRVFEPLDEEIQVLVATRLGTAALCRKLEWAYSDRGMMMPTVFISVRAGTVADWAELESRIRGKLGKGTTKYGIVIDLQFQIANS